MKGSFRLLACAIAAAALGGTLTDSASAQLYINELFFNPGGGASDVRDEFIEIRGETGASLENTYLIFIENEDDELNLGPAGILENVFDLSGYSLGSNGFLAIRQKFNRYSGDQVNPFATQLVNSGPNKPGSGVNAFPGFGNNLGEGSTVGASDEDGGDQAPTTGAMENSGFTAMLIRNDSGLAPIVGFDLDIGNDGLDVATGQPGWTILDSVGIFGEIDETETGILYGMVNYGVADQLLIDSGFVPRIPEGTEFQLVNYELEYIGRWGNSTGHAVGDWHISNLTDNPGSGSSGVNGNTGPLDLRQSGDPHPADDGNPATAPPQPAKIESNRNVPYGVKLLTVGGPNYLTGDYNHDGIVDTADYTVWRDTQGTAGSEAAHPAADGNHDFAVNSTDYGIWASVYGSPNASPALSESIPEPFALVLAGMTITIATAMRRRA